MPSFHSVALGCSNRPWHLLLCKLLDDRDVVVADPILNTIWEGIKDLKTTGRDGY